MSALASNFEGAEDFYKVIDPAPGDLGDHSIGACYRQKSDVCWMSNRAFEVWTVIRIRGDRITIQPINARHIKGNRTIFRTILETEYVLCAGQRQRLC